MSTINERIEKKFLRESESKIEELKPVYGWMAYAYESEKYKSSEIYRRKKEIVAKLKVIANEYNIGKERDIYKQLWNMISDLKLSPQFWTWVDYNLDRAIIFNDKFDSKKKLTAKFLWSAVILGNQQKEQIPNKQQQEKDEQDEQLNTEN